MNYKRIPVAVVPPVAAMAVSIAYPFLWGAFALGQTLLTIMTMTLVTGSGIAISWFAIGPAVTRMTSPARARWFAFGILTVTAAIIASAIGLLVVLGSRTPGLAPPVMLALGIDLLVYIATLSVVCFTAVSPRPASLLTT